MMNILFVNEQNKTKFYMGIQWHISETDQVIKVSVKLMELRIFRVQFCCLLKQAVSWSGFDQLRGP